MMKVVGDWNGIPGLWLENGKRFIATHHGWELVKKLLREESHGRCEMELMGESHAEYCNGMAPFPDAHHRFGRGAGKRDDRIVLPDGTKNLFNLSRHCHAIAKIERRRAA